MGEGAGVLVLEEYEHAKQRGAKIYAEILGYGMSGDAYHITAPAEDGNGAFRAMRSALKRAGLDAGRASTTSTRTAPRRRSATRSSWARSSACSATTPTSSSMSSTKSAIGHLLGAAGSVEAIFSILAMRDGVVPPTLNLDNPSPAATSISCRRRRRSARSSYVLSNSFGFGGTNASLIFGSAGLKAINPQPSARPHCDQPAEQMS